MLRLLPACLFFAAWGFAFAAGQLMPVWGPVTGSWLVAVPAFFAVFILPGFLLDRVAGIKQLSGAASVEGLARAFAISVGLFGVLGLVADIIGRPLADVIVVLLAFGTAIAFLPQGLGRPALDSVSLEASTTGPALEAPAWPLWTKIAIGLAVVLLVAMAAGGENIARDRMWYLAYISRIPIDPTVNWREPFFGIARWPFRFVDNAWIFSLGVWKALGNLPGIFFFERILPVLLAPLVVFAWLGLSRSVFTSPARAVGGLLGTLAILTATRFPFFSPSEYAFFNRVSEDKFVACLILAPICLSMLIDYLRSRRRAGFFAPPALALALAGLALSHALVYLSFLICMVFVVALLALRGELKRPWRLFAGACAAALAALPAGLIGMHAVHQAVKTIAPLVLYRHFPTHPVVRSHLRMERLLDFQPGGPIVAPHLLADPLLLTALAGLLLAFVYRRKFWGGFILVTALPALLISFTPFLAPAFGSFVLPWMIYRELWAVPFGFMLAVVFMSGWVRLGPKLALGFLLAALSIGQVDWMRLNPSNWLRVNSELSLDSDTRELLGRIAELPAWSVIMTGAGLSELIPAYTGRHVAAISDRGTIVFVGFRQQAEARLRSRAAVLGLRGGNLGFRNQHAAHLDVTHTVWEKKDCDRKAAEIFRNATYTLCAERSQRSRVSSMPRTTAVAQARAGGSRAATIGDGLVCTPPPHTTAKDGTRTWRRLSRWSAEQIAINCRASFPQALDGGFVRIELKIPHADESLVYRIRTKTIAGKLRRRHGAIDFRENPRGEIRLPADGVRKLSLRLTPAFLPYLHLKALEIRSSAPISLNEKPNHSRSIPRMTSKTSSSVRR